MGSTPSRPATQESSYDEKRASTATEALQRLSIAARQQRGPKPAPLPADLPLSGVAAWRDAFNQDGKARLAHTLISKTDLATGLVSQDAVNRDGMVFNLQVSTKTTPITNQKSSGRCWLFACANCIRTGMIKKYNLGDFELSQAYLFFYDSLEKANWFLENVCDLAEEPLESRLLTHLFTSPENDGGQWNLAQALLEKYGIVPKVIFPESFHSSNTSRLDGFLTSKLREHALELRAICAAARESALISGLSPSAAKDVATAKAREAKGSMMASIYRILAITLGAPPAPDAKFVWEYSDASGKAHSLESTPLEFYHKHCAGFKADDFVSLINDPRNEYGKLYTVDRLGNVVGGPPVLYVNVEMDVLKSMVVKMLKADQPVWFGCDVGKSSNSQLGIMDAELFDHANAFGTSIGLTKAERLRTLDSGMTHAMVIPAAHVDKDGRLVRCKVENSWSEASGDHGYFMMTEKWMDEYLFQVVVPKALAPSHLIKVLEAERPIVLPAWDPMGSLA